MLCAIVLSRRGAVDPARPAAARGDGERAGGCRLARFESKLRAKCPKPIWADTQAIR